MCVCVYYCAQLSYTTQTQYSSDNYFPSYPPHSRHSSDDVYWRGGNHVQVMSPAHVVQWSNHLGAMYSRA